MLLLHNLQQPSDNANSIWQIPRTPSPTNLDASTDESCADGTVTGFLSRLDPPGLQRTLQNGLHEHSPHLATAGIQEGEETLTMWPLQLFNESPVKGGLGYGGCELTGIHLSNGRLLRNLGVILLDGAAILTTLGLLWATQRRKAAVGRRHEQSMQPLPYISLANGQAREIQLFLVGYIILSICEIFTIGGIPLNSDTVIVRQSCAPAPQTVFC